MQVGEGREERSKGVDLERFLATEHAEFRPAIALVRQQFVNRLLTTLILAQISKIGEPLDSSLELASNTSAIRDSAHWTRQAPVGGPA